MFRASTWGISFLLMACVATPLMADATKKSVLKDFRKALRGNDEDAAIASLGSFVTLEPEDAFDALFEAAREDGTSTKVYDAVIASFPKVDGIMAHARESYGKSGGKSDFRPNILLCDIAVACFKSEGEGARALLVEALDDKMVHVQSAAAKGLEKSMHRDAIEPLLNLLEKLYKKKGRSSLLYDVQDALLALTGLEYDLMEDWWKWWEPNKATFDPSKVDTGGKTGVARRKKKGDNDFVGVPILSKNIVFVLDKSGSMNYVMRDDIKGLPSGDGSDKGGRKEATERPTPETKKMADFWSRWGTACRNLKDVIRKLKKGTQFNIVAFSSNTQVFKKKAVPMSSGSVKQAFKWIDELKSTGETDTMDALKKAFSADARTTHIYFLSDGIPSLDGMSPEPTKPILEEVASMNRFRKIKIHTFGYDDRTYPTRHHMRGLTDANKFLKELAESTGGKFTLVKVDPNIGPDNRLPVAVAQDACERVEL